MQPGKQKYSLRKCERLRNKPEISELYSHGHRTNCSPVSVISLFEESDKPQILVAFIAPKRVFKKAIDRNRVKRILKEVYRTNKPLHLLDAQTSNFKIKLAISLNKLNGISQEQIQEAMNTCFSNLSPNA